MGWDLQVGEDDLRTAIQQRFGGSASRGISAPAKGSRQRDIMLWWRPERGEAFGYADGWAEDGSFFYSGTGQHGDQRFEAPNSENGRLRDHAANGDAVRLLSYTGDNRVRYVGQLRLDPSDPWRWRDGPDAYGTTRRIIQFRFLPVGRVLPAGDVPRRQVPAAAARRTDPSSAPPHVVKTDLEALRTRTFQRALRARDVEVRRLELTLVHDFATWLAGAHGVAACGLDIPYAPEARNLRADLFLVSPNVLVEAKASSARENVRMAIGQLLDYRRYLDPRPSLCLLTPTRPADDMLELLDECAVGSAWRQGPAGFALRNVAL